MRKFLFVLSVVFLAAVSSCSHSSKIDYSEDDVSLKNDIEKKINSVSWTKEIESTRLSEDISSVDSVEKSIKLTPVVFLNSRFSSSLKPVYPYLEGFGSLDISGFNSQIMLMTRQFSDSLLKGAGDNSLFDKADVFELALFMKDLKDSWQDAFGEPYPVAKKNAQAEKEDFVSDKVFSDEEKTELSSDDASSAHPESGIVLFDEYIIGEPFEMNSLYEVPVRFIRNKTGFVDIMIFFFKKADAWNVNQLQILKMEAF